MTAGDADRPIVLAVDDNHADLELLAIAFEMNGVQARIDNARDGEQAMHRLEQMAAAGRCPDLIILDLNMPRKSGLEVLAFVKGAALCRRTQVVIFTTSDRPADRDRARHLGADAYYTKPPRMDAFLEVIKRMATDHLTPHS
ncbi:MAG: response regulator [Planctomycetes bacterium]|nr:response regulator [Planctomycetota bacterium]